MNEFVSELNKYICYIYNKELLCKKPAKKFVFVIFGPQYLHDTVKLGISVPGLTILVEAGRQVSRAAVKNGNT